MDFFKKTILSGLILIFLLLGQAALAQEVKPQAIPQIPSLPYITKETQEKQGGAKDFITGEFAAKFLTGMLAIAGVTAVIFIIVGGIQMLLAVGNEEQIKKAKNTLLWSIVGLVIAILAAAIVQIVTSLSKSF